MEEFKLYKKSKRPSKLEIKYFISNKGNIKLVAEYNDIFVDEEILSVGNILYIHDGNITGARLGEQLYRIIYKLFNGDIPKGYQIHHKDFNHYNNSADNLECLSAWDHLSKHSDIGNIVQGYKQKGEEYNRWLESKTKEDKINKIQYTHEDSLKDWQILYKRFENKVLELKDIEKSKIKQERLNKIKQERLNKINSEEYYINDNGKLVKRRSKWTEERRAKTMKTRYEKVYNNEEWKDKIRVGVTEYFKDDTNRERLSKSMQEYYKLKHKNK